MYHKYFLKNKDVLFRKFVASGLAAVFSLGIFGSYAGALKDGQVINSENILNNNIGPIEREQPDYDFSEVEKELALYHVNNFQDLKNNLEKCKKIYLNFLRTKKKELLKN